MIEPDAQEISLPDVLLPLLVVKLVDETVAVLRPLKLQKKVGMNMHPTSFKRHKSLKTCTTSDVVSSCYGLRLRYVTTW